MKISDIVVGRTYSNGRGIHRKVVEAGEHLAKDLDQKDLDCIRYTARRVANGGKFLRELPAGTCTRHVFAAWAARPVLKLPQPKAGTP